MKGAATELIHAGELDRGIAAPLTTPIYETTTFVFDNAQEVVAYNEGRSARFLYSRYTNPTVVSVEQKLAAVDCAEAALVFSSGMGASATILLAQAPEIRDLLAGWIEPILRVYSGDHFPTDVIVGAVRDPSPLVASIIAVDAPTQQIYRKQPSNFVCFATQPSLAAGD